MASNNLGDPKSKRSPGQASFRQDLRIISEAAGIGRCRLVLSEDHRFLDSIVEKKVVRKKLKYSILRMLGVEFAVHVQPLKKHYYWHSNRFCQLASARSQSGGYFC